MLREWGMVSLAFKDWVETLWYVWTWPKRRLSQVRDTERFICTAVCTVKNRDVIMHVYDAQHHARFLLLATSYNITCGWMSTVRRPGSRITLFSSITNQSVIKSRPWGTQPHCCSSINTTQLTLFIHPGKRTPLCSAHLAQSCLPMLSPWKTNRKQTKTKPQGDICL